MKSIVLIGMPASGKTSVAKYFARKYDLDFVDIDEKIEKTEGKTIKKIFEQNGEEYFRTLEADIIKTTLKQNQIIATGGGAFENSQTQILLLENTIVIYLETSIQTLYQRAKDNVERPLLQENIHDKIIRLFNKREKNYKLAHIKILTDNKTVEQIANEIWECVNLK